jgi:hypothetical protein
MDNEQNVYIVHIHGIGNVYVGYSATEARAAFDQGIKDARNAKNPRLWWPVTLRKNHELWDCETA